MSIACKVRPIGGEALLPDGYRRCEYLESTGTQYIDTGVIPDEQTEMLMELYVKKVPSGNSGFYGCKDNEDTCFYGLIYAAGGDFYIRTGSKGYSLKADYSKKIKLEIKNGEQKVNNNIERTEAYGTLPNRSIYLCTFNNVGSPAARTSICIYAFSIASDNQLQLNFIPCLDDKGKPCMFDTVSRTPYYNKGTSEFLYKLKMPLIRKLPRGYYLLDYLESTGTQWMDTGIRLSSESEVRVTLYAEDSDTRNTQTPYGWSGDTSKQFYCYSQYYNKSTQTNLSLFYLPKNFITSKARVIGKCDIIHNAEGFTVNGIKSSITTEFDPFETPTSCQVFRATQGSRFLGHIYSFSISRNGQLQLDYQPCLDPTGKPCMWDYVTRRPFYNQDITDQFIAGMTMTQALNLANLPITKDGTLTVSLPWEAQWNTGVQNALNAASVNGWTITVQYRDPDVGIENIPISFLESTGTQYLPSIEYPVSSNLDFEMDCQFTQAINRRLLGADSVGCYWGINEGRWEKALSFSDTPPIFGRYTHKLITKNGDGLLQIGTQTWGIRQASAGSSSFDFNIANPPIYKIFSAVMNTDGVSKFNLIPILDSTGRPCMFDAVTRKLFYNAATTGPDFIAGMTWEQVRKLQLPTSGGRLTLSLPYEASIDGIAQTALEQARANGWVLTLQYDEAEVPEGYSKLDFLESTGVQWIDTGINLQITDGVKCKYSAKEVSSSSLIFGTYKTPLIAHFSQIGGIFKSAQFWWGELGGQTILQFTNVSPEQLVDVIVSNKTVQVNDVIKSFASEYFESAESCKLFSNAGQFPSSARIYSFNISRLNQLHLAYIPCLDPEGVPCMYDLVSHQPFRNKGTGQFTVGMTLEQVRSLSLPAGGGQLTLALPYEASIDKLAQTALEQARENGWELTLQYAESDVPAGYRKLDFLESTGTQYINTGVKLSSESEVKCSVAFTSMESFNYVYGGMAAVWLSEAFYVLCNNSRLNAGYATQEVNGILPAVPYEVYSTKLNKNEFNVNGTQIRVFKADSSGFTEQPVTCWVFGYRRGPNYGGARQICRVYSFSISRAGEMQVDYVPCISPEGKLGMYNKIDGTLYENKGTGSFIAGLATVDDVLNLWLPETNGTITISVPADTPDSAVDQLRTNNPTWQIAIQYRTDNEN